MDERSTRMGNKLKGYWAMAALMMSELFKLDSNAKREYQSAKHQTYGWRGYQNITPTEERRQAMAWEAGVKSGEVLSKVQRKGVPGVPGVSKMMRAAGCKTVRSISF